MGYYRFMNPIELARRLLDDLVRLPLIFKLFLFYAAGAASWRWWKARQQAEVVAESTAWPVYRARVVWAQVSDRLWEGEGRGWAFLLGRIAFL